jgi:uncharacterized repeat protein (TIGR03847 family)
VPPRVPRQVFDFDPPERFVVGTVGQPGERTFFLQATGGGRVVSVALEKMQVNVLVDKLEELLDEVRRRGGDVAGDAGQAPGELEDVAPLEAPIFEEFRVGTMALAWDGDDGRVVIEARAQPDPSASEDEAGDDDVDAVDPDDDSDVLRVRFGPETARAFIRRARRVVAAGRPPCPLCGLPLDPEGHICPRQNGHRH